MSQSGVSSPGEMPIGAVVLAGEEILGEAYTQEQALGRRIVHADLLAMEQADAALGFSRTQEPLTLAVSLEPCLMCLGAAVTLGVKRVWFALESPNDGAVDLLTRWHPPVEQAFFAKPVEVRGGLHHERAQALFAAYASGTGPLGMAWAQGALRGSGCRFMHRLRVAGFGRDREGTLQAWAGPT